MTPRSRPVKWVATDIVRLGKLPRGLQATVFGARYQNINGLNLLASFLPKDEPAGCGRRVPPWRCSRW